MPEKNKAIVRRHYAAPEEAYWMFFTAFNAKDAEAWAGVMSYPHVRVPALGSPRYFETPEAYVSRSSWERMEATGWVRTQGIEPTRLHESADKVHLAGGWTRYNAADEPIISNRVAYILTRLDGSWGIQARFGVDSFMEGENVEDSAATATDLVERYLEALDALDFADCARLSIYPFTQVGIGEVQQFQDEAALERWLAAIPRRRTTKRDVRASQTGTDGVNVAVTATFESGQAEHALFLVAKREGRWGIAGRSVIGI